MKQKPAIHASRLVASSRGADIDLTAVRQCQQATWACVDFAGMGTTLQIVGERLAEAVDLRAGEAVLDVAAGNGNASLAAARRFARVTSTDFMPHLLEKVAACAKAEGLDVDFRVADPEALPFSDGSFDVVLSAFGAMLAPGRAGAARESKRVVRSGGRIGLAYWTPEGFIGQLARVIGACVPIPAGTETRAPWGSEPRIVELFGPEAADIYCARRNFNFRYRSAAHWIDVFRNCYGPVSRAYAALDRERQTRLTEDISALLEDRNIAGPGSLVVPGEYLEVVITKR
jgi:SAM-dependent methyltransferase